MMVLKEDTHNSAKFLAAQIGQDPEGWLSRIAAFAKIDPDDITKVAIAYQDGSAEGTSKGVDAVLYHVRGQRNIGVLMFDNKKHKFTTKIDKVDNYFDNWGTVDVYPAYPTRKGLLAMSPKERK